MKDKVTTVLVDDHKVFVQGMDALLSRTGEIEVLATFTEPLELMRFLAENNRPDVLLLDIEMGSSNGVDVAIQVLQLYPTIRVIMLSTYFEEAYISELMSSGISGYLLKSTGFKELKEAIKSVHDGGFSFSPEIMQIIVQGYKSTETEQEGEKNNSSVLTDREIELIRLIADELTMKEIASKLFLSEHTIKTHRKNIMEKLDVKNTAGLIKKAFLLGFIK